METIQEQCYGCYVAESTSVSYVILSLNFYCQLNNI